MIPVYGQTIIKVEHGTGFTKAGSPIPVNRKVIIKPGHPQYDEEFRKWSEFEEKKLSTVSPARFYK